VISGRTFVLIDSVSYHNNMTLLMLKTWNESLHYLRSDPRIFIRS